MILANKRLAWVVLFVAILPLLGFWATGIFDLDEGFYAAVVAEMNRRGEWITPFYNGAPWFEKPILLYWVAKPCVLIFGEMWGPRMPSVLSAIGVYCLIFWAVNKRFGQLAASYSVLFLSGSLLMIGVSRMMLADGLLGVSLVAAMLFYFESLENPGKNRWLAGLFLGLTVLAKGPVGILLFTIVTLFTIWLMPSLRKGYKGGWILAFVAISLVIASWYWPVYQANGQVFVQKFLIEQNIGRFTGGDKAHTDTFLKGFLLYLGIMLIGASPWIYKLPKALKQIKSEDLFLKFCAIWGLSILGFFTISSAKLPHYILPSLPPLAIVVGVMVARTRTESGATGVSFKLIRGPMLWSVLMCAIANIGFGVYYYGAKIDAFGFKTEIEGLHSEVHGLAREARALNLEVAAFQLPRREKALGTGGTKLQETSHPSLAFYLGSPFIAAENLSDLTKSSKVILVITRQNRITDKVEKELFDMGFYISSVETKTNQRNYRLYKLGRL